MGETTYPPLLKTPVSARWFSEKEALALAKKFGTPLFIIDEGTLRRKLLELESAYSSFKGSVKIAYSMKANFNPFVLKVFIDEGIMLDVTSIGEHYFYKMCGGDPENVIYTSVTEEEEEYRTVLREGVKNIVVSSYNGLMNLIRASEGLNVKPKVLIRVNPEVGVKAEVRASYRQGKFGVPFNTPTFDSASNILRKILLSTESLSFSGFHFHLGSQIVNYTCFLNALEKLENFILKMKREWPELRPEVIDIGGGTPVSYTTPVPTPKEMGMTITNKLNSMLERIGGSFTLIVESGRFLSAEACVLVSKVVNTKVYGDHKFVFIDAGYHLLLDAALLHQEYPLEVIPRSEGVNDVSKIKLAGRLCDTYDIFPISSSSALNGAEVGKLIVFYNVGAYSIVFNMPFHCQTKPFILFRKLDGEYVVARRAQTLEELFREEGGESLLS